MPGVVVLVVSPDRVLYHGTAGTMDAARGVAMRKDAIFRIASMAKAITLMAPEAAPGFRPTTVTASEREARGRTSQVGKTTRSRARDAGPSLCSP